MGSRADRIASPELHITPSVELSVTYTRGYVCADTCPAGCDIGGCEAAETYSYASKCPKSVSPHAVPGGSITNYLKEEVPNLLFAMSVGPSRVQLSNWKL